MTGVVTTNASAATVVVQDEQARDTAAMRQLLEIAELRSRDSVTLSLAGRSGERLRLFLDRGQR